MIAIYVAGGLLFVFLIVAWSIYNRLIAARNIVEEAFSGIDVQLKKRFELIPALIQVVKGYNEHEAQTLIRIVEERISAGKQETVNATAESDKTVTKSLRDFRFQVEAYPDLKANMQYLKLMENLAVVEDELAMSRRYFNGAVRDLNTKIEVFPAVLFASMFGFKQSDFYELDDDNERNAPDVNLN